MPSSSTSAGPNTIVSVDLPPNSLVDLSTFTMFFESSADFGRNIETIIERYEVSINGVTVSSGCNSYGHLFNIIADFTMGSDAYNRRKILQNSDGLNTGAGVFAIQNWLGFVSSVSPNIIDTNMLGNVRIRITLASPEVLTSGSTYTLNNISFSVDCISIDDGIYYQVQENFLAKGGVVEMPFNQWSSFSSTGGMNQTTPFSLSSNSINRCFATFVQPATKFVRYGSKTAANSVTDFQFSIAGKLHPNYRPAAWQSFGLLMNDLNMSQDCLTGIHPLCNNIATYQSEYWVASCQLDHGDPSFVSGLDTRGNMQSGYFITTGVSAETFTCLVFVEYTSILRVGMGRQIDLIS